MGYTPNYSHLVGIMISKTIGFFGVHYFQTNPILRTKFFFWTLAKLQGLAGLAGSTLN